MQPSSVLALADTKISQNIQGNANIRGSAMKKGDLIRNKNDGEWAVVLLTFTKFFQDSNYSGEYDYGVADTAVRIKWLEGGQEHVFQQSKMHRNWEVISESR